MGSIMLDARERSSSSGSAPTAFDDAVVVAASRAKIDAVPRAVDASARERATDAESIARRVGRVDWIRAGARRRRVASRFGFICFPGDGDGTGRDATNATECRLSIETIMAKAIASIEP
jgi:hypothetical protein